MRKLIAPINLTLDGFCDHIAVADYELHLKANNLLKSADTRTLKSVGWKNAVLAGMIRQLMNFALIDEYRLSVQPIVLGNGPMLFKNILQRNNLKLIRTETLSSEVVTLYYAPEK
jgi:dihydrofolate reductase